MPIAAEDNAQSSRHFKRALEEEGDFCYNEEISQTPIPTNRMSIETCIAHAIHKDLDIVEALPEVQELPVEQLELYVERYVLQIQESLSNVIEAKGDSYLRSKDAAGLCAACLESGIVLPARMMLRMCQTIVQLTTIDAKFILDTPEGASLYYMKMDLAA